MIPSRTESGVLDITNDVSVSALELADSVSRQLTGDRIGETNTGAERESPSPPLSPAGGPQNVLLRKEGQGQEKRKRPEKQKKSKEGRKRCHQENTERVAEADPQEVEEEQFKNSDDFSTDDRPELFRDDAKFNRLSYETAAKICWEFKQLKERKAMKVRSVITTHRNEFHCFLVFPCSELNVFQGKKSSSLEKADDKLPLVKVEAGEDDAKTVFCVARRQLRPPVDDNVNPKCIELCHNL